jgi:alkaline phosphatase D
LPRSAASRGRHLSFAPDRPQITHGVQSGDVSDDAGVVWGRTDRPSRMLIEVATSDSFRDVINGVFVDALPESDFTAKALIDGLPPGQDIFYRVSFQDLSSAVFGEPQIGRFRTPPNDRRSISFLWSGDTMGQGWGIDVARGGMRTYTAMRGNQPDFFIHCGDNIYADCPIAPEQKLPDGGVWRNIVTEEKSNPAMTLAEYRGNYKYNLLDDNLRAFNAAAVSLDRTFGPQVAFHKAPTKEQGDNLAPCYGLQFFGHVAIDGATGSLTVTLKDVENRVLWSKVLDPAPEAPAQMTMMSL